MKVEVRYKRDQSKQFYKNLIPFNKVKSNIQDAEDFINYGHSLLIQKE